MLDDTILITDFKDKLIKITSHWCFESPRVLRFSEV